MTGVFGEYTAVQHTMYNQGQDGCTVRRQTGTVIILTEKTDWQF